MKIDNLKLALIFCFISNLALCQPYNPIGEDDPEPEPVASINNWLVYMFIIGLIYAYLIFKKKQNALKQ